MRHSWFGVVVAALLTLSVGSRSPANADFVFTYQDRYLSAEAGASDSSLPPYWANSGLDWDLRPNSSGDYTPFDEVALRDITFGRSEGYARSHQRSETNATLTSASGEMVVSASTTAEPPGSGGGSGNVGNRFQLFFEVDSAGLYELTTALNHTVSGEVVHGSNSDLYTRLYLLRSGLPAILERSVPTGCGTETMLVQLAPGVSYEVLIDMIVDGTLSPDDNDGASFSHTVDYSFLLNPVPEPSTLALLGTGAIGLLGYTWRRRRQNPSPL